jgi:hypothetical protein
MTARIQARREHEEAFYKRAAATALLEQRKILKTRACRVLALNRSTFIYRNRTKNDGALTTCMQEVVSLKKLRGIKAYLGRRPPKLEPIGPSLMMIIGGKSYVSLNGERPGALAKEGPGNFAFKSNFVISLPKSHCPMSLWSPNVKWRGCRWRQCWQSRRQSRHRLGVFYSNRC